MNSVCSPASHLRAEKASLKLTTKLALEHVAQKSHFHARIDPLFLGDYLIGL